jgi:hypothetical protein
VISLLRASQDYNLKGFSAADKLAGKASALLMVNAGIENVFAQTISRTALQIFYTREVSVSYDKMIEQVLNREHDGPCPMEQLLIGIDDPQEAFTKLKEKIDGPIH